MQVKSKDHILHSCWCYVHLWGELFYGYNHTFLPDEGQSCAEAPVSDTAVWGEMKHHDAAEGEDRSGNTAATQHSYEKIKMKTKQIN